MTGTPNSRALFQALFPEPPLPGKARATIDNEKYWAFLHILSASNGASERLDDASVKHSLCDTDVIKPACGEGR